MKDKLKEHGHFKIKLETKRGGSRNTNAWGLVIFPLLALIGFVWGTFKVLS